MTQEHRDLLAKCLTISPTYVRFVFIKEHDLDYKEIWQVIRTLPIESAKRAKRKLMDIIKCLAIEAQHGACPRCSASFVTRKTAWFDPITMEALCSHCARKEQQQQ